MRGLPVEGDVLKHGSFLLTACPNRHMSRTISTIERSGKRTGGPLRYLRDAQRFVRNAGYRNSRMKRILTHPIAVVVLPLDSLSVKGPLRLAERVTGVDLVPKLVELPVRKGYGIFLVDGKGNVAVRTRELLEQKFPDVRIVGTHAPTEEDVAQSDHSEILERIQAAKPEILLVALGNPKQEKWIWMHRKRLGVPVAMGVGGSFEIIVGDVRRAPRWIQRPGLEWAMRLMQEPARLGPRYIRDFTGLGRKLPMALLAAWTQRPHLGESHVSTINTPQAALIGVGLP